MDDLISLAKALKDRLIAEDRFDEASRMRDLIRTIEGVGPAQETLKSLVFFYAAHPADAPNEEILPTGIPVRQQLHKCRFNVMKVRRSPWPKDHCPWCGDVLPPAPDPAEAKKSR